MIVLCNTHVTFSLSLPTNAVDVDVKTIGTPSMPGLLNRSSSMLSFATVFLLGLRRSLKTLIMNIEDPIRLAGERHKHKSTSTTADSQISSPSNEFRSALASHTESEIKKFTKYFSNFVISILFILQGLFIFYS